MASFEYVASGLNHTFLNVKNLARRPEPLEIVNKIISSSQGKYNHKIAFLFNAYVEAGLGPRINERVGKSLSNIYSDSGGLQAITLGKEINSEFKKKVYETQGKHSSIAMSFDEIPLVLQSDKSSIHDITSRYYDPSILEEKARLTGKNLKEQIEYFKDNQISTKPFLILQGNDLASYQRWLDFVLEEVGFDNIPFISGIASGTAALGLGDREDIKRFFILSKLKYPSELNTKHLHLLGIGSLRRLSSLSAFIQAGYWNDDTLISYDSTTHTSGLTLGNYFIDTGLMAQGTYYSQEFFRILEDMNRFLLSIDEPEITKEQFYNRLARPSIWVSYDEDKRLSLADVEFRILYAYLISSISNFMKAVDMMMRKKSFFRDFTTKYNLYTPAMTATKCRDQKDFDEWEATYGKYLTSKGVMRKEDFSPSLESFFGE